MLCPLVQFSIFPVPFVRTSNKERKKEKAEIGLAPAWFPLVPLPDSGNVFLCPVLCCPCYLPVCPPHSLCLLSRRTVERKKKRREGRTNERTRKKWRGEEWKSREQDNPADVRAQLSNVGFPTVSRTVVHDLDTLRAELSCSRNETGFTCVYGTPKLN